MDAVDVGKLIESALIPALVSAAVSALALKGSWVSSKTDAVMKQIELLDRLEGLGNIEDGLSSLVQQNDPHLKDFKSGIAKQIRSISVVNDVVNRVVRRAICTVVVLIALYVCADMVIRAVCGGLIDKASFGFAAIICFVYYFAKGAAARRK